MRKSYQSLGAIVEQELNLNLFDGQLFVFCNKTRNIIKILYWENNGFVIWQKRLEKDRFSWPTAKNASMEVDGLNLNFLLDGINIMKLEKHKKINYSRIL